MEEHGKNSWISLYSVIGNVTSELGLTNANKHIPNFARWSYDAMKMIGGRLSFQHYECEIDVKNYHACLPTNLHELKKVKHGSVYLDRTTKDFVMFNKSKRQHVEHGTNNANFLSTSQKLSDKGQKLSGQIDFNDTFVDGDLITLTVVTNVDGDIKRHFFSYTVLAIDTLSSIVTYFYNALSAGNYNFSVNISGDKIDIIADTTAVSFTVTPYTDSITGSLEYSIVDMFRAPRYKSNVPAGNNNVDVPPSTSFNLADPNANNIDVGQGGQPTDPPGYSFYSGESEGNKYDIQNGKIYFNSIEEGKVGLSYKGIKIDDHGLPMISTNNEMAVTAYLKYMHLSIRYNNAKLPHHIYKEAEMRWQRLCSQARGNGGMPNVDELRSVGNILNSLLPMPGLQYS